MTKSTFMTVVGVLTVISQVCMRLSPVPELYRVHKQKSTGVMALMPLVSMLLSNHTWGLYGYAVDNIFPLLSVCVFGEITTTALIIIYAKYCNDRVYMMKTLATGLVPATLVTIYFFLVESGAVRQSNDQFIATLGYLSDATTFALFLSPFEKIKLVVATKSSAAIPVLLCIVICINSSLWIVNGIADKDLFILVPNVVGVVLSLTQIALYFVYRPDRPIHDAGDGKVQVLVDGGLLVDAKTPMPSPTSPAFQPMPSPT